jgi:hypothetical protein
MALRGVQLIAAMTLVAELQDFARFADPRQLMAYVGLVPGEHSSGGKRRQGSITKAGNSAARRMLVEVAWQYLRGPRVSPIIARRHDRFITDIAWAAQLRLNAKFRRLLARKVMKTKAVVAVARELAGFIWAIARHVHGSGWPGVALGDCPGLKHPVPMDELHEEEAATTHRHMPDFASVVRLVVHEVPMLPTIEDSLSSRPAHSDRAHELAP